MIRRFALFTAVTLGLAGCVAPMQGEVRTNSGRIIHPTQRAPGFTVAPPNAPSGARVDMFARDLLDGIQSQSFAGQREYCGYIVVDSAGSLRATPPRAGTFAGCEMPEPRAGQGIVASYHTHGSFSTTYDNEVPSLIDLLSDFEYGIDGYVSTPGGRVWLVDDQTRSTRQLCGIGCVRSDPNFRADPTDPILPAYTIDQIRARNAGF